MPVLRFNVDHIVGLAYRDFLQLTRPVLQGDRQGSRIVRNKIKMMIRENPMGLANNDLASQVRETAQLVVKSIIQARENPSTGNVAVDIRSEHVVDGKVNIIKLPKQTLLRAGRFMRDLFKKSKDHPNAEVVREEGVKRF